MLLIFPPVAKPCEPPAGVALLSSALKEHGIPCQVYDANIEGLLYLVGSDIKPFDSWSRRAVKNRDRIIRELGSKELYQNWDRYHQRVYDLNRLLSISVDSRRFKISLSNYSDCLLSDINSKDLVKSAETYRENPFYPFFEDHIRDKIFQSDSQYVGISLIYLNQALISFALAGWIKQNFKDKKIIMGGGLVSSWMSRPGFRNPFEGLIDVMIRGEGESQLLNIAGIKEVSKRHYIPDYDFAGTHHYFAPGRILPFRASIGCYWSKCRFCPEKAETRAYGSQKASHALQDLKTVEKKYTPEYVHLIDNAVTPAFLRAMSKNEFSFKWYGFVRFGNEFLDPAFCRKLKKSGCGMLKLGLESGDQEVLDQMNKGTRLENVSIILENLHHAGILTFVYLLFGTSFEDETSAFKTLEYVKAHSEYIDYLNLAVFNLPRFSEDAKDLDTREFYHGDLSLYLDFSHPSGWDRKYVKQFLDKKFKKQVYKGKGIRKNPAFFSSNHAMFLKSKG